MFVYFHLGHCYAITLLKQGLPMTSVKVLLFATLRERAQTMTSG
jgi:hypothetical protein